MQTFSLMAMIVVLFAVASCGGDSGGNGGSSSPDVELPQAETDPAELVYDSELSSAEKKALDESTGALGRIPLEGSAIRGFAEVFGGNSSANVVNFFERRVNYAVPGDLDTRNRIRVSEVVTAASNIGTALWLQSAVDGRGSYEFVINGNNVDVNSSRVGIMQFGEGFVQTNVLQQVNTLVHEARHSDCPGGISANELSQLRSGQIPADMECGFLHVTCPSGPLAGEAACDALPWGPYAVGAIHSLAISRTCEECSETVKAIAETLAADSFSRLLYTEDELLNSRPDMSSSNNVGGSGE